MSIINIDESGIEEIHTLSEDELEFLALEKYNEIVDYIDGGRSFE